MARGSWLVGAVPKGGPLVRIPSNRGSWFVVRRGRPKGGPLWESRWRPIIRGCVIHRIQAGRPLGRPLRMRSVGPRRTVFIYIIHSGLPTGSPYGCGPWDRGGLCLSTLFTAGSPRGAPTGAVRGTAAACVYTAFVTFASWPAASMARTKDGGMSSFFRDWPMRRPRMTPLLL